jgi:hypothetical protein
MVRAWIRAQGPLLRDGSETPVLLADVLRSGQQQGDVRPDLDATRAGYAIFDVYLGVLYRWVSDEGVALVEDLLATLDVVLPAMDRELRTPT